MKYNLLKEQNYQFKDVFRHDTLGIRIVVGRDVNDEDAKTVVDKLLGIKRIFEEKRINLKLSDAFKTLVIVASDEERKLISRSKTWAGLYSRSKDRIVIDVEVCKDSSSEKTGGYDYIDYVLVHEIGHAIHLKYIDYSSKSSYDKIGLFFLNYINVLKSIIKKIEKSQNEVKGMFLNFEKLKDFMLNRSNDAIKRHVEKQYNKKKSSKKIEALILTHLSYDLDYNYLEENYPVGNWDYQDRFFYLNEDYFFNSMKISLSDMVYFESIKNGDKLSKLIESLLDNQVYKENFNSLSQLRKDIKDATMTLFVGEEYDKFRNSLKKERLDYLEKFVDDSMFGPSDQVKEVLNTTLSNIKEIKEYKDIVAYFENEGSDKSIDADNLDGVAYDIADYIDKEELNDIIVNKTIENEIAKEKQVNSKFTLEVESLLPEKLKLLYKEKYDKHKQENSLEDNVYNNIKSSIYALENIMPTEYGLMNIREDFAENFSLFILNPDMLDQWNINRLVRLMTMSRAQGKTVMQAHKNIILNKYIRLIIESVLTKGKK